MTREEKAARVAALETILNPQTLLDKQTLLKKENVPTTLQLVLLEDQEGEGGRGGGVILGRLLARGSAVGANLLYKSSRRRPVAGETNKKNKHKKINTKFVVQIFKAASRGR